MTSPASFLIGMPPAKTTRHAVGGGEALSGRARLAELPDGLAVHAEQDGGLGLLEGDVDRTEHGSVHAGEGLEMAAGVEHGDVHRHADFRGFRFAGGDQRLGLVRGDVHRVVSG